MWAFVRAKKHNVPEAHRDEFGWGDVWTWTSIDPDTKLMPRWRVGLRDAADYQSFLLDLASRLTYRVQLTTDGHKPYLAAVEEAFERSNLTTRMSNRRFTRLTNAFSKKVENHAASVALNMMYYNFGRPHKSLANPYPRTPAMAAGIADYIWTCEEIAGLLD